MKVWQISLQNIKNKPLYTVLSIVILSLSITLLLGVQQLKGSFQNQINNNLSAIDLVIGAKGSPLQLVLASVLHIDNPTGNISYQEAKKLSKNPMIKSAIPISYGDNYKGFRIVGTSKAYYNLYKANLQKGRYNTNSREVVLGAAVAKQTHLKIGDTFLSSHGLIENDIDVHDDKLIVVGILNPTQKVIDRLILTNLETVWDVHEHNHEENHIEDHEQHEHHENHIEHHKNDDKEITSMLLSFKSKRALLTWPRKINENSTMQAALPIYELNKLYSYTSVGLDTIVGIAFLILIISSLTIFLSLYKMVKERAFDLAILRTYGATNFQLIKMLLYEAFFIVCAAFVIGILSLKITIVFALNNLQTNFNHHLIQPLAFKDVLEIVLLIGSVVILSVLLAIYPIIKMNISTILSNEK